MTRDEVIRSIRELAELMEKFSDDPDELYALAARMRIRLAQLRGHVAATEREWAR